MNSLDVFLFTTETGRRLTFVWVCTCFPQVASLRFTFAAAVQKMLVCCNTEAVFSILPGHWTSSNVFTAAIHKALTPCHLILTLLHVLAPDSHSAAVIGPVRVDLAQQGDGWAMTEVGRGNYQLHTQYTLELSFSSAEGNQMRKTEMISCLFLDWDLRLEVVFWELQ